MRTRPRTFWMPVLLLCLAMLGAGAPRGAQVAAAMPAPAEPAQADCATTPCNIFLPVVSGPPIVPILNDPLGGVQVDSIAPTLTWTSTISGTRYTIQVATSSQFISGTFELSTTKILSTPAQATQRTIPRSNFNGVTTYYWRVGVYLVDGIHYSQTEQFTTAPEDPARFAPPPQYLDPPNNGQTTTLSPTLTWAPAPGADAYRVRILNADGTTYRTSGILEAPQTTYALSNLTSKVVYKWQVRVHSSYGWSDYGPLWQFRTP